MSEENKAVVRRFHDEVLNKGNLALIDELCSHDLVDHTAPPGLPPGVEGAKRTLGIYLAAFPDLHVTMEDMIAEGDRVVVRWTASGTHKGDLMGIAPTGRRVTVTGIAIDRIAGGKTVEHWEVFDQMGLMQQLGVIPAQG